MSTHSAHTSETRVRICILAAGLAALGLISVPSAGAELTKIKTVHFSGRVTKPLGSVKSLIRYER